MKAKLHKLIGTAVLGLALLANSLPAWAGLVILPEVSVGSTGRRREHGRGALQCGQHPIHRL